MLGSIDLTDPRLFIPLRLLAIFCLQLLRSRDSRGRARNNLVDIARQRPRHAVQAVVAVLLWIASMAIAVDVAAHFAVQTPEALSLLYKLGSIVAIFAATTAGLVWTFGAKSASFFPPDGDRRLAEAAKRLGVSTEEAAMRAIDAGLPQLNPKGD